MDEGVVLVAEAALGMSANAIVVSSREAERRRRVTPESVSGSVARREDGAAPPTWPVR